ncbi:DUF4384 domain-containing protein [Amylibacter sp. SFDW26]|uniref:DUF4384 domain-containing protein n=1 Tax=Amylibacter sp. SFDW26 TaxID=2652722 RepID=UPI00186A81FF|nr:DUF4384 domain-containing protein [Amylibacter sp. SFDW26]
MDRLLTKQKNNRILVSSTGITDLSRKISVGADDMLVNAINHMNVSNGKYVFLDQSLERKDGQIKLLTFAKDDIKPQLYFRGAITQVDSNAVNDQANVSLDLTNAPHPFTINGGALTSVTPSLNRSASIVSVDLHLVSYPSKTILPGGSVANSMIVTNSTFGTGGKGLIKLTGYNLSLSFNRIESVGQAVRNLVELGVIELLGRHAGVPYWECLNIEPSNEKKQNLKRSRYKATPKILSIIETQRMLEKLEYLSARPTGIMDRKTHAALSKFQSDNRLIATGDLNYDTYEHLKQKIYGYTVNGRGRHAKQPMKRNPNGTQIKLSAQSKHKAGDLFKINIHTNSDGYLTCFHQSDSGPVTQILPQQSDVRLQVTANTERKLPSKQDSFKLKFEETGVTEHVLCTLQDFSTTTLFSKQAKSFAKIPVRDITQLPRHFIKTATLTDWAMISRNASP